MAKEDLKVLVIELGKHTRFSLGETLLPQSALWPFIIEEYFDIPEIQHLSHTDRIVDNITASCGVKHSIGFGYHQNAQEIGLHDIHQPIPPHLPFYSESHLLQEDVDQYLLEKALEYGIDYLDETKIEKLDFLDDCVVVETNDSRFTADFLSMPPEKTLLYDNRKITLIPNTKPKQIADVFLAILKISLLWMSY